MIHHAKDILVSPELFPLSQWSLYLCFNWAVATTFISDLSHRECQRLSSYSLSHHTTITPPDQSLSIWTVHHLSDLLYLSELSTIFQIFCIYLNCPPSFRSSVSIWTVHHLSDLLYLYELSPIFPIFSIYLNCQPSLRSSLSIWTVHHLPDLLYLSELSTIFQIFCIYLNCPPSFRSSLSIWTVHHLPDLLYLS